MNTRRMMTRNTQQSRLPQVIMFCAIIILTLLGIMFFAQTGGTVISKSWIETFYQDAAGNVRSHTAYKMKIDSDGISPDLDLFINEEIFELMQPGDHIDSGELGNLRKQLTSRQKGAGI